MVGLILVNSTSTQPTNADQETVRRTAVPVNAAPVAAEAESAPDFNERENDPNPDLGMAGRQLAGHVVPSQQTAPSYAGLVDDAHLHNDLINRQVSSSGVAAAREMSGRFGHGTMARTESLEPTIRDGGAFGADYFAANKHGINDVGQASTGVQPDSAPRADIGAISAYGVQASRDANASSVTDSIYSKLIGG